MKAVIIAAGRGERLRPVSKEKPKPLTRLLGLSLIERVIFTAREAGIREFVVVVGYRGEMIKGELGDGSRHGVVIEYVENPRWQRGNGVSVLAAEEALSGERFILLMSDHLFEPSVLTEVMGLSLDEEDSLLVVDGDPGGHINIDDATRVLVKDGAIVDIGKGLTEYNAVDCGIFSCSPGVFDALRKSIDRGDETLSGGMRWLAGEGRLKAHEISGRFWIDIDTGENLKRAEEMLCRTLIKPTDGVVSRYLNRPLSIRISKRLVETGLTPNVISLLSFLVCLASALLLSAGSHLGALFGGVLVQLSSILDGCDGEVARLKFRRSEYGAWFDAVLDRYGDAAVVLGLTYGWWSHHGGHTVWLIGYIALLGTFMNSYTAIKYDPIITEQRKAWRFGRDVRSLLIMAGALLNQLFYLLVTLAVITNLVSLRRILVLRRARAVNAA